MEVNELISVLNQRADQIAEEETKKYIKEFPELNLTDEARIAVKQRSMSQLTLQVSKFKFRDNVDMSLEEQFNAWFEENEEEDLRKACQHCLKDEAKKIRDSKGKQLSSLDKYLKKHLGDVHEVD